MTRLLIIGASGLLGINLAMKAMHGHEVIGVDRGRLKSTPFRVLQANLFHTDTIDSIVESTRPDWLVNCAALANLEECEQYPERAQLLNAELPGELANTFRSYFH